MSDEKGFSGTHYKKEWQKKIEEDFPELWKMLGELEWDYAEELFNIKIDEPLAQLYRQIAANPEKMEDWMNILNCRTKL